MSNTIFSFTIYMHFQLLRMRVTIYLLLHLLFIYVNFRITKEQNAPRKEGFPSYYQIHLIWADFISTPNL